MSQTLGKLGEARAAEYLLHEGYEIIAKNYRYKRNEIDIIAKKDRLLVFVEVKTKSYTAFGDPEEAVDERKAERILEAANQYIYDIDWPHNIRFDVVALIKKGDNFNINHFEDAFH